MYDDTVEKLIIDSSAVVISMYSTDYNQENMYFMYMMYRYVCMNIIQYLITQIEHLFPYE